MRKTRVFLPAEPIDLREEALLSFGTPQLFERVY